MITKNHQKWAEQYTLSLPSKYKVIETVTYDLALLTYLENAFNTQMGYADISDVLSILKNHLKDIPLHLEVQEWKINPQKVQGHVTAQIFLGSLYFS